MILVIAEKPSVAQTIAAVLGAKEKKDGFLTGSGYIVSWCVGHLVGLAEAAAYGEQYKKWSYDSLPILPQEWKYTVSADKEKQFKTLKELMHRADVSEVVNACDAGREGELIFRFVYEMAGCKKPMRRLWISSMEDSAIKEGFSCLKNGRDYDPCYESFFLTGYYNAMLYMPKNSKRKTLQSVKITTLPKSYSICRTHLFVLFFDF